MKFLIDENYPRPAAMAVQRLIGARHEIICVGESVPKGTQDTELFRLASIDGVNAIITSDIRQVEGLDRINERVACRNAGLHWIGVPRHPRACGRQIAQLQAAQLLMALGGVLPKLTQADVPQAYLLKAGSLSLQLADGYPQDL